MWTFGHVRGKIGMLAYFGAPSDVTVTILRGDAVEAVYSVASWRMAVKFAGEKAYAPRP